MSYFMRSALFVLTAVVSAMVIQFVASVLAVVLMSAAPPVFGLVGGVALVAMGALLAAWLWDKMFVWFKLGDGTSVLFDS